MPTWKGTHRQHGKYSVLWPCVPGVLPVEGVHAFGWSQCCLARWICKLLLDCLMLCCSLSIDEWFLIWNGSCSALALWAMPWPTLQFILWCNGALYKVVRPKCTSGLVHGLRLGQLSDFVGLKVTFNLWWRSSWRALNVCGDVFDGRVGLCVDKQAECVVNREWILQTEGTRQTHVWPVSEATEVLPLTAVTLYSDFWWCCWW